jgi:cobalt-zinc-cadmium efflux system outer membrane protein
LTLEQAIDDSVRQSSIAIGRAERCDRRRRPRASRRAAKSRTVAAARRYVFAYNRTDTYQLSQPIELGGKRSARIKLAEQDQALARGDVNVTASELRADVTAAYLEALTAQEHVALARESLSLAGKATNAAGRRVAAGKISPLEQTRSSVAEAGARLSYRKRWRTPHWQTAAVRLLGQHQQKNGPS